ncbi:MAG: cytochrome ubiquinol oxidase subunit I, partial [Arcobacteraceae bacterium]
IDKGKLAVLALEDYKSSKKANDMIKAEEVKKVLEANMQYFGFGHIKTLEQVVPPVATTFYAFHIMVTLGGWFIFLFAALLYLSMKKDIIKYRVLLHSAVWSIPLGYIAGEAGWVVSEVGRQPWAIQDLMPVGIAATHISTTNVMISFVMFAVLFTALLIAEIKIMTKQIQIGPDGGHS